MVRIDLDDARPLEEQIVTALRQAIAQRTLAPAKELPPVRQLAGDLGVHWNTVARAYRRLAAEGLITVRRGRGAVTASGARARSRVSRDALRAQLATVVADGLLGGLSRRDIAGIFQEALASFGERTRE